MNKIILLLFSFSCFAFAQDKLIFNQGEQWDGTISSVNDKIIKMKSSLSKEELKFKLENLKALEFGKTKPLKGTHKITLINGDGLTGDLEELNEKFLVLNTQTSGVMQIPRNYVSIIEPVGNTELISTGTSTSDGWKGTINTDNSFQGSIYRDVECKQPFIITAEVDLADAYNFYMMLNNTRTTSAVSRFYMSTTVSSLRGVVIINGQRQINNGNLQATSSVTYNSERAKLGSNSLSGDSRLINLKIFFNPLENFIAVNVNNIEVGKTKMTTKFDFDKLQLSLRSHGGKPYLKQFKIEKWDGKYTSYVMAEKVDDHDNILLKNGDVAHGKITNIKDKKLAFSSKLGDHKLNMELISTVFLNNAKSESVKKNHLVRLESGQKITGNLVKVEDGFVYIKNDLFPNLKVKREFCRVLINNNFASSKNKTLQTITRFGDNRIFGEIELLKDKKLKIKNANLIDELAFDIDTLNDIKFATRTKIEESNWLVDLVNGDSLPCKIKSMNLNELTVSSNSGEFTIKTADVQRMFKRITKPRENSRTGNVVYSYGSSQLQVKLPEKSEINFTVELSSNGVGNFSNVFQMRLFGEKQSTRNSYYLQLSTFPRMYFRKSFNAKEHKKIKFQKLNDISIKVDKNKALFEIWVNGEHTHTFTDPDGFQAKGDGLTIYNNSRYKVSKLRFNVWGEDKLDKESFVIDNDFKVYTGTISAIKEDSIKVGDKTLKLRDVREITLGKHVETKVKSTYSIRLINTALLRVSSLSIDGNKVKVQHPLMGELILDKKGILEIKAN